MNYNVSIATENEVNITKKVLDRSYCNGVHVPMGMLIMLYHKTSPFDNPIYYLTGSDYILSVNGSFYVHNVSINNSVNEHTIYEASEVNSLISGKCEYDKLVNCTMDEEKKICMNETEIVDIKIKYENGELIVVDMEDYNVKIVSGIYNTFYY